eukprot:5697384-Amphidinium_carterae.1
MISEFCGDAWPRVLTVDRGFCAAGRRNSPLCAVHKEIVLQSSSGCCLALEHCRLMLAWTLTSGELTQTPWPYGQSVVKGKQ